MLRICRTQSACEILSIESSLRKLTHGRLSQELYSKPTHFILELIQNADDNTYPPNVTPTLSIVYRTDGYLWIGLNEVGFNEENVLAICRIGASTKHTQDSSKRYIGEKGIGFKSVFRVADVVWISSGALQFKFDVEKPLGMIAPEWSDVKPNTLLAEKTMFCFQVPKEADRRLVQDHMLVLKPELLQFLQQLKRINVKIQDPSGTIKTSFCISRGDSCHSGLDLTSLSRRDILPAACDHTDKYLICRRTATQMPHEEKRTGVLESEVILGFPVTKDLEPRVVSCMTFSFLPIRAYGLPVCIRLQMIAASLTNRGVSIAMRLHPKCQS